MISPKSKLQHPPLCPKTSKASTFFSDPSTLSRPPIHNKNQRLTAPITTQSAAQQLSASPQPRQPKTQKEISTADYEAKQEQFRKEYQQYSRKNYLRKDKGTGKAESDLTERLRVKRNYSTQGNRGEKSRSALEYAKYFIKQISVNPTEPSSKDVQESVERGLGSQKVTEGKALDERTTLPTRQDSKRKNRTNIMQKLKSLKNIRSKSKASVQRQLVPSLEKRSIDKGSRTSSRPKKISGNITNLVGNESLLAKMKARSRNRRIVLKVRQLNQTVPTEESMSLMLNSIMDRSHSERVEVGEKIQLHLQLLNLLPSYVKQFKQIYQQVECWDELLFLTYKKFYLQRRKIEQAFSSFGSYSPFRLPFALVTPSQLKDFTQTLQGIQLEEKIHSQNQAIETALRELYNHIIEKSGKYINLIELDNFALQVYWLMSEQVRLLLGENEEDKGLESVRRGRVGLTLKCCFLMAFLNGQSVDIQSVLMGNDVGKEQIDHFWSFLERIEVS